MVSVSSPGGAGVGAVRGAGPAPRGAMRGLRRGGVPLRHVPLLQVHGATMTTRTPSCDPTCGTPHCCGHVDPPACWCSSADCWRVLMRIMECNLRPGGFLVLGYNDHLPPGYASLGTSPLRPICAGVLATRGSQAWCRFGSAQVCTSMWRRPHRRPMVYRTSSDY